MSIFDFFFDERREETLNEIRETELEMMREEEYEDLD